MSTQREIAVFGGGCFWCTEAVFQELRGVVQVRSGYAGGHVEHPTYEQVCSARTGHAEVVEITFNPEVIPYGELLNVFFATHDPTTPDRQGHDVGPQYRSVIFWQSDAQREVARNTIDLLERQGIFDAPIVTQLCPPATFWPAEPEHKDYFRTNPGQGYCNVVIAPKMAKFRRQFADNLKS
nr:peptide-methionine (S)-S-oxide reductase MsrA [Pseudomonas sp.]